MSHKLLPRLGSAIATTILSLFSGVSLVGVDKAQAATLTYDFRVENAGTSGFFKFNNSSLTGIGVENIAVSEGRLDTFLNLTSYFGTQAKEYYNLAGAIALFYQGDFRGLQAGGSDYFSPNVQGEPYPFMYTGSAAWSMATNGLTSDMWTSYFQGYKEVIYQGRFIADRAIVRDTPVSYTLVNTEPEPVGEPVPEPLTAGGTALALAGLSWLKHKKKMAA
jgi:hypothetical protein